MKINKRITVSIFIILLILVVGNRIIQEKYCYNYSFNQLDRMGIKLGNVPDELKGFSPLEAIQTKGSKDWWGIYIQCNKEFNLLTIDFSIFQKSYSYYNHFIDW
ncbi:MAG: hypothetical protein PHV63_04610 [Candidatus Daviesbacteria bacterium]|nr:hypothetical protein [Candidatus Daviesbacteria bacterium]